MQDRARTLDDGVDALRRHPKKPPALPDDLLEYEQDPLQDTQDKRTSELQALLDNIPPPR